jgi:hypothetical protein
MKVELLQQVLAVVGEYRREVLRRTRANFRRAWAPWTNARRRLLLNMKHPEKENLCILHSRACRPGSIGQALYVLLEDRHTPLIEQRVYPFGRRGRLCFPGGGVVRMLNRPLAIGPREPDNYWLRVFVDDLCENSMAQWSANTTTIIVAR